MASPYYQTPSPQSTWHRNRSQSPSRDHVLHPCKIVKSMNNTGSGSLTLRALRNSLYPDINPKRSRYFERLWSVLTDNERNFEIDEVEKDITTRSGNEHVSVKTTLSLCNTHCRKGTNGRNRDCDGNCGALHVCRTFLLLSQEACPFNSKSKKCMFGHKFRTPHNLPLLKEHNLTDLNDSELRRLFCRPLSRCSTTFPQVCIYYNKVEGKKCSNEKCKSLHLCSDFIQKCCYGNCPRNHRLGSSQVNHVLKLFAIDQSWTDEMIFEGLQRFVQSRPLTNSISYTSESDSYESDSSEPNVWRLGSQPRWGEQNKGVSYNNLRAETSSSQVVSCSKCEALEKALRKVQVDLQWLTTHVKKLEGKIEDQKVAEMNRHQTTGADGGKTDDGTLDAEILTPSASTNKRSSPTHEPNETASELQSDATPPKKKKK